jgi:hypothetical protein
MARETVTIEGLDDVLRRLKALGAEASKRGGPVRKAVLAGAKVVAKEARANIERIVSEQNKSGDNSTSGLMAKSIKPLRGKANRNGLKGETYTLRAPAAARYPDSERNPGGDAVQKIANILEYGGTHNGVRRDAHPWMRPAFHAKKGEAVTVMQATILKEIEKLEKKLSRT